MSHVSDNAMILYPYFSFDDLDEKEYDQRTVKKPVHPMTIATRTTTPVCNTDRAAFAPSANLKTTPSRMLTCKRQLLAMARSLVRARARPSAPRSMCGEEASVLLCRDDDELVHS
jgi:hypothetical protein